MTATIDLRNKKVFIFISIILLAFHLHSQTKLESWRDHLPFTDAFQVVDADTRIYCATPGGLFYFNKSDNSINKFTRIQGLSDNGISAIAYSGNLKELLVAYSNGNIDIIENNRITNISDIKVKSILEIRTSIISSSLIPVPIFHADLVLFC